MKLLCPGRDITRELRNLILDLNGTLTVDGHLIEGVKSQIDKLENGAASLSAKFRYSGLQGRPVADELGIPLFKVGSTQGGEDKTGLLEYNRS